VWHIKKLIKQHDHYTDATGAGDNKRPLKCALLSHNRMPQMPQVLRECAISMLTAGMSTRAVAKRLSVHFSTISHLQHRFKEFGSMSNRPQYRRQGVWVSGLLIDVNDVNRVPHGGGGVMVWAGISYGQLNTIVFYPWQFKFTDTVARS
jgi:hypothetical protein